MVHIIPLRTIWLLGAIAASDGASSHMVLQAQVGHGVIIARLSNKSDQAIRTVGNVQTPIPGAGGFFVEFKEVGGKIAKYCSMIDGRVPAHEFLESGDSIVFRDTLFSLKSQYCLRPGKYSVRVIYYNQIPFGEMYSKPIFSNHLNIVIPMLCSEKKCD